MAAQVVARFCCTHSKFVYPDVKGKTWFPGHMAKGLREATEILKDCDLAIEVHDARVPSVGRNPNFMKLIDNKPHILVLNKSDLCDIDRTLKYCRSELLTNCVLTNCKAQYDSSIKKLMKIIRDSVNTNTPCKVMVLGIPNVGKSSIINSLRRHFLNKGKAAPIGFDPGITRRVSHFIKISESPHTILLCDAPGILTPQIDNGETLVKLAAIGTLKDHLIGEHTIADYILYALNLDNNFKYTDVYGLSRPCHGVDQLLVSIAHRLNAHLKGGTLNLSLSAEHFIKQFRMGRLGTITFD